MLLFEDMLANTQRTGLLAIPLAWLQSPGFAMLTWWRLANRLNRGGSLRKLLAMFIWRYAIARQGCYISLSANIGPRLRLPHSVGIVIGDGTKIGADVTIYQNVTVGRVRADDAGYPIIEDGATIYAGAIIIGAVTVGTGATVGGNSVVLKDVAAGFTVIGSPARQTG